MNNNKLILLATILIVAVAVLVLKNKLSSRAPAESELKLFPTVTEKNISAITIREGTARISLRKQGEVWVVSKPEAGSKEPAAAPAAPLSPLMDDSGTTAASQGTEYPVDSAAITSALEKIVSLEKTTLISEKPEKQTIFEVDTTKGIQVELFGAASKSVGTVIIGKTGPDYNSNYVRKIGSDSVFMAQGGIRYAFFTDLNRWRDKSIVKFDKATAQGLTLARNDGSMITIAHADSGNPWEILAPIKNPAKTDVVESILDKLSNLLATDFQDEPLPDSAMGFDKPEIGVTVSFKNGSSRNIIFGKKNKDNKYWVKVEGKEQIFLVSEYVFNQVNKKLDDLKGEPLVKPVLSDSTKKK